MTYTIPPFVSERHGLPPYTHCVAVSMLMAINALHPGKAPSTYAEADALYAAGRPFLGGGESVENVLTAAQHRYGIGHVSVIGNDDSALWAALSPGHSAVAIGRPANLPASSVLRKWVGTAFIDLHCILVERLDDRDAVWILDPMGPTNLPYKGNLIGHADLAKFYVGSGAILGIAQQ